MSDEIIISSLPTHQDASTQTDFDLPQKYYEKTLIHLYRKKVSKAREKFLRKKASLFLS